MTGGGWVCIDRDANVRTLRGLTALAADFIDYGCADEDPLIQSLRDLVEDTGGAGLCHDVSEAFARFAFRRGWYVRTAYSEPDQPGAPYMTGAHRYCLTCADGRQWLVDFTARQFDPSLPFPLIMARP